MIKLKLVKDCPNSLTYVGSIMVSWRLPLWACKVVRMYQDGIDVEKKRTIRAKLHVTETEEQYLDRELGL